MKCNRNLLLIVLLIVSAIAFTGCTKYGYEVQLAGGDNVTRGAVGVIADANNSSIGIEVVGGSDFEDDDVAVGLYTKFNMGDVAGDVLNRAIPGEWGLAQYPAKLYGGVSVLYDTAYHNWILKPSTELRFFPDWPAQPTVWLDYYLSESNSDNIDDEIKLLFGLTIPIGTQPEL